MADVYFLNNLIDEAMAYYKKSINSDCTNETLQHCYGQLGFIYGSRQQHKQAEECFLSACAVECLKYGCKMNDIIAESNRDKPYKYRTDVWDKYIYYVTIESGNSGTYSNEEFAQVISMLAKYGNRYAKDYCNRAGVDYNEYLRNEQLLKQYSY
jgi:tetratricopeptide (TPR) repeat protein